MLGHDVRDIMQTIQRAASLYHRLVLFVAPSNTGKSAMLHSIGNSLSLPLINLNLELSRRMLELTGRQRTMQLSALMWDVVSQFHKDGYNPDIVIFDNTEMLFDPRLGHDPLRLLQSMARNRTVVASWNGEVRDGFITYATPSHPEYYRYPVNDLVVVSVT